jgi:hypothetical protein
MKAFGNIEKDSQVRAIASGAISSGKTVVINSDGTVSSVVETTDSAGSSSASVTTYSLDIQSAYDSSNNRVVIVFRGANNNPTAAVGTVSGTSVSFGTPVVIDSSVVNSDSSICFDSSNNKVVVTFGHDGSKGVAYVGTVSGTSISFGSEVVFNNAATVYTSATFDSTNNKVVVFYRDSGNSNYGTAVVGTVSGTSISFGSEVVFNSANTTFIHSSFDSSAGKVVAVYRDNGNSNHGTAIVGTVSGTSISFGSEAVFATTTVIYTDITYDTSANKHVIVWQSPSSTTFGNAIVGTVSGTSISFGSAVVFESAAATHLRAIYDPSANKTLVLFRDEGNSNKGTAIVGTVSGTSISFGSPFICFDFNATSLSGVYDSSTEQVVASCANGDSSENVHSSVISVGGTNLTSENYIGMSGGVVSESALSIGPTSVADTGTNAGQAITYDTNSDRVVIAYRDTSNGHGKAIVGTVSGSGISFGTPVTFNAANTTGLQPSHGIAFDSSNNKVVIVYKDGGNSNYGTAIVGTVDPSDNSISFGSEAVFESAHATFPTVVFDSSNNKVLISYSDVGDSSKGKAIVGTVSGTSISFGSAAEFEAGDVNHETLMSTFDSANNKAVIAYRDGGDSNKGKAVVATISGTSVSFGTPVEFTANDFFHSSITFDSTSNKVIIIFPDQGNSQYGTARVGTVSGTAISFGTAVVWHSGSAQRNSVSYSSTADKSIVFFRDGAASDIGKLVELTVSGTSITASSAQQFSATTTSASSSVFDPDNNVIVNAYIDEGNTTDLETVQVTGTTITRAEVADGGKAVIDSTNAISRNQIGLTAGQTLYVQTDGTLSETADDPSVTAGTAISATELIVKG